MTASEAVVIRSQSSFKKFCLSVVVAVVDADVIYYPSTCRQRHPLLGLIQENVLHTLYSGLQPRLVSFDTGGFPPFQSGYFIYGVGGKII